MAVDESNYLVVDLEGTCCDDGSIPDSERETIEIGAVMVDRVSLKATAEFSSLVRPVCHPLLTDFCCSLTGIQQSDVDKASPFSAVFPKFCNWIERNGEGLFCSWSLYDKKQFERDCSRHGIRYPFREHLDLCRLFTSGTGRRRGHRGAMKVLGITPQGCHHRGISDARNIVAMLPTVLSYRNLPNG